MFYLFDFISFVQDGLSMVTKNPKIIHGYKKAILTPNAVEFDRLFSSMVRGFLICFNQK